MKKFMKGCVIAALIMLTVGLVLGIAAGSVRGRRTISEVVEKVTGGRVRVNLGLDSKEGWGILWGGDLFQGMDDVNYDIKDSVNFNDRYDVQRGDVEKYKLEGSVESLEIEAGGCAFRVKDSGDGNYYVEAENAGKFQAYIEDDVLHIITTTGSVRSWNELNNVKITLYVPEGRSYDKAKIELGAGTLSFPKLRAGDVSVNVGAGKVDLPDAEATKLEIEVGAGQVVLTDMKVEKLDVQVGMGEFVGDGVIDRSVEAECAMGNLELCVVGRQEDFNYEISGAMGSITLGDSSGKDSHHSQSYSGFSTERTIDNGADKDMEIECSMGNVTIRFRD